MSVRNKDMMRDSSRWPARHTNAWSAPKNAHSQVGICWKYVSWVKEEVPLVLYRSTYRPDRVSVIKEVMHSRVVVVVKVCLCTKLLLRIHSSNIEWVPREVLLHIIPKYDGNRWLTIVVVGAVCLFYLLEEGWTDSFLLQRDNWHNVLFTYIDIQCHCIILLLYMQSLVYYILLIFKHLLTYKIITHLIAAEMFIRRLMYLPCNNKYWILVVLSYYHQTYCVRKWRHTNNYQMQ